MLCFRPASALPFILEPRYCVGSQATLNAQNPTSFIGLRRLLRLVRHIRHTRAVAFGQLRKVPPVPRPGAGALLWDTLMRGCAVQTYLQQMLHDNTGAREYHALTVTVAVTCGRRARGLEYCEHTVLAKVWGAGISSHCPCYPHATTVSRNKSINASTLKGVVLSAATYTPSPRLRAWARTYPGAYRYRRRYTLSRHRLRRLAPPTPYQRPRWLARSARGP